MFGIGSDGARVVTVALACVAPVVLIASANGPVPARTGGFGEMTCHQCHSNNPLNDPSGQLTLSGVPDSYTPGKQYLITITVAHPQIVRGGFQLSARFATGDDASRNAGVFRPVDELTEVVPDDGGRIMYVQHTAAGASVPMPGSGRWKFEWIAPAATTPISFHLAANAANGDGLSRGDFVYTATAISPPAAAAR
jgi:hypothetical protein